MHPLIKKILDQFENEFMRNSDHRIEDAFDDAQYEGFSPADRKRLMRELILSEVDLRFEDNQRLVKQEYEQRFFSAQHLSSVHH